MPSLADPYLPATTANGVTSAAIASLQRRVAALERGGSSVGGGTSVGPLSGEVVTGTLPTPISNTSGAPQWTRLGLGTAPVSGQAITVNAGSATNFVVKDTAHGDHQQYFLVGNPLRWDIRHGTSAAPVTVGGSTMKISRLSEITDSTTYPGTEFSYHSALQVVHVGTVNTKAQPVAVSGVVRTTSTVAESFPNNNPDACGVMGIGLVRTAGVGRAIGGYFEGYSDSSASPVKITGLESQVKNHATDSAYEPADIAGAAHATSMLVTTGGTKKASSAIRIARSGTAGVCEFSVGIGIPAQNPVEHQSFRDDGNAVTSLQIGGTHTYGMTVAPSAGAVAIGSVSSSGTKTFIKTTSDSESALVLKQNSATQSVNLFQVSSSVDAELFGVGPTGNVRVSSAAQLGFMDATPTVDARILRYAAGGLRVERPSGGASNFQINAATSQISSLNLAQNATDIWRVRNAATNIFEIYGVTNDDYPMQIDTTSRMLLREQPTTSLNAAIDTGTYAAWDATKGGVTSVGSKVRNLCVISGGYTNGTVTNTDVTSGVVNQATSFYYWYGLEDAFNGYGSLVGFGANLTASKPSTGTFPNTYNETAGLVSHITMENKGAYGAGIEVLMHIDDIATTNAGPARVYGNLINLAESNDYSDYNTIAQGGGVDTFGSGSVWLNTGSINLALLNNGSKRVGTGLLMYGSAPTDEAAGESGFVRAFVLKDTANNDIFTIDGFGRIGMGIVRDQSTNTSGLPAKICLAASTVEAGGIWFGTDTKLYRTSAGVLSINGTPIGTSSAFISSVADTNTIDHTVSGGGELSSVIPTTATPQVTGLGVGVAAPATGFGITNNASGQSTTNGVFVQANGTFSLNRASAGVYFQAYSTSATNVGARFRLQQNATTKNIHLGFSDGGSADDGGGTGNGTGFIELYKTVGANTLTTSNAFSVGTALTVGTNVTITDAGNVILGTTTGTKIGTATTQKIGFWNATPVVQPAGWGSPTGTATRTTFDTTTVTLAQLAERVRGIIDDLKTLGVFGA